MRVHCLFLLCLAVFFTSARAGLWAQSSGPVVITDNLPLGSSYQKEEFPLWAHYLRRFEIILLGSLPFTYLLSNVGYDYIHYGIQGFDNNFLPAPFGPGTSSFTEEQRIEKLVAVVISALVLSTIVAVIDLSINLNSPEFSNP